MTETALGLVKSESFQVPALSHARFSDKTCEEFNAIILGIGFELSIPF
jgi:hypothetical protein